MDLKKILVAFVYIFILVSSVGVEKAYAGFASLYYVCNYLCPQATGISVNGNLDQQTPYLPGQPIYLQVSMVSDDNPQPISGVGPWAIGSLDGGSTWSADIFPDIYTQLAMTTGIFMSKQLGVAPFGGGVVFAKYSAGGYNAIYGQSLAWDVLSFDVSINTCPSAANSCGEVNYGIAYYGGACVDGNAQTIGAPAEQAALTTACTSAFNSCLQTQSNGTYTCNYASCTSTPLPNSSCPICGSASGGIYTTTPTSGLCSSGSPSFVSDVGYAYNWTCSGPSQYGGIPASCSATKATGTWTSNNSCPTYCGYAGGNDNIWSCTGGNFICNPSSHANTACAATAACVCSSPLTGTQTLSCSVGYSGSIAQSRSKMAYPDCSWGTWTTTSDTCTINSYTLTVNKTGTGRGTVTGAGIYNYGSTATAGATASTTASDNSAFTGWSGDCASNGQVYIDGNKTCTATFTNILPTTPTLSNLWKDGIDRGISVPAYDPSGYQLYASAISPAPAKYNLYYVFEWSTDNATWTGATNSTIIPSQTSPYYDTSTNGWTGGTDPGGWAGVIRFANSPPGTYYVRAWARDQNLFWSLAPSAVKTITLTYPTLAATCTVSPTSGYTGDTFTWTVSGVSGGDRSYTYSWNGNDGPTGTTASVAKTYATVGIKTASTTITSAGVSQTFTCAPSASVFSYADLTAGATTLSPSPGMVGRSVSLSGLVGNTGPGMTGPTSAAFPNMFQINAASITSPTSVDYADASSGPSGLAATAAPSVAVTGAYIFDAAGTYYVRTCANYKYSPPWTGSITETDYNNNCGEWKSIYIYPALSGSCSANVGSGNTSTNFNWSASVDGGDGTYSYLWTGGPSAAGNPNSLPVTNAASVSKTYSTTGIKTATTMVTSMGYFLLITCTDSVTVTGNQPPTAPNITGAATGTPNTNYPYAFTSSDPEEDTIQYQVDWTSNGIIDYTSLFIASGATQIATTSWSSTGLITLKARAVDDKGSTSGWTSHTITLCATGSTWNGTACVVGNQPPTAPIIGGFIIGAPNTSYTFTFTSTDPESNTLRYQIDWDNNGIVDQTLPSTGYVASGTILSQPNGWAGVGAKIFKARAVDSKGSTSSWTSHTITLSCAKGSTWRTTTSSCVADVAIGSFYPTASNVTSGTGTNLNWSGVTGGGFVTCTITPGPLSATPYASGNRPTGNLTVSTTYTLTCGNNVGPNATKSTSVTVNGALLNGVCAAAHYACTSGSSTNNVDGASSWTWTCAGANSGASPSCSEAKATVGANTLTLTPTSCIISADASTCHLVYATWTTTSAVSPKLVDGNTSVVLSTLATQLVPGLDVYVAYPQTVFNLQDGTTVLDTKIATATCAVGSTWSASANKCLANVAIGTFTSSPVNPIPNNTPATLSWTGVTGGGPITCSIDNNVGPVSLSAQGAGNKTTAALTSSVGFVLTCGNGAGPDATKLAVVTVAGVISGSLILPASCEIPIGASTCVVEASWDLTNATNPYLFDANPHGSGILHGKGYGTLPNIPNGHTDPPVNVAYPQTQFQLRNGNDTVLSSQTVTASCAGGSTWNGSVCLENVAIGTFSPTSPNITTGTATALNWTGVTGGGTVTCSIDNNIGAASLDAGGNGSKSSGTLSANTTFIITCGNSVGPNATKSTSVTVFPGCVSTEGNTCSPANVCGATNTGTIKCDGSCTVSAPSNATCPPTVPEISALWKGATYYGPATNPSVPAYDASGYQVKAMATSPSGANLYYGFEWSINDPSPTAQSSDWTGSGGWGSVTHYINYAPGTYHVRAWAVDSNNNQSAASAWLPITLTAPNAISVSCIGSPGNPYINQQVTWSSSISGGVSPYTYSWGGDETLGGSTSSITKSYASAGIKQATVTITDAALSQASATCTTGAAQPNGPAVASTGGTGVSVGSCVASLSANPTSVVQGNNTALTWSVSGGSICATSCSGGLGFNTGGAISGTNVSASVLPTPPSTSYSLTCTAGTYGPPPPANTTVNVTIPTPVITVNNQTGPVVLTDGGTGGGGSVLVDPTVPDNVTIMWEPPVDAPPSGPNAIVSCVVTKNGVVWQTGLSSPGTTDTVTTKTTYTVDCETTVGKHTTKSILVNVLLNYQEF